MRASLALGYDLLLRGKSQDATPWLRQASGDPLLGEYVLYWTAQAEEQGGADTEALADWQQFLKRYPRSIFAESALEAYAALALQQDDAASALAALNAVPELEKNSKLLSLRGQAREATNDLTGAAKDFAAVYYNFPLSDSAQDAGNDLATLRAELQTQMPPVPVDQALARADSLFEARRYHDAAPAYLEVIPELNGTRAELAQLREARCRAILDDNPAALTTLQFKDADVDAERFAALTDLYRSRHDDADMLASAEAAAARAPSSEAAANALFEVGNSFWVQLDREKAAAYYDRAVKASPGSANAPAAAWRAAWTAYLTRAPDAGERFENFLRQYPRSEFVEDALYWAGRLAEAKGQLKRARAMYLKLQERFTQSYFGSLGGLRLRALGDSPVENDLFLDEIPAPAALPPFADLIPENAAERVARAHALESIALDIFAEKELRQAWMETGNAELMLEAARAAAAAERYPMAIVLVRKVAPEMENRPADSIPREVWLTSYLLPYAREIRRAARIESVDPMLLAGLVRQESAFDKNAKSGSGAIGLSQLLPKTARKIARHLHVRYSRSRLTDPAYNLRIGSAYLAQLLAQFGSPEAALAAYNAGEDRVTQWTAGAEPADTAQFVESIPFSETRDYVQIVMRNAAIYRRLYGARR